MPLIFALTMFVSATLLFLVQPMVGKMILPLLGGTPAVWNTCMVFYQALLLAGYYYSHRTTSKLDSVKQTRLHTIVMLVPLVAMVIAILVSSNGSPIPIAKSLSPQGDDFPFFGVIAVLFVAIAMPFFVVSTSAPLLQKWFGYTGHPSAKDPYFLYGASNFGSLLALVAYPAVVEPNLKIIDQTWVFGIGYAILVALVWYCGYLVRNAKPVVEPIVTSKKQSVIVKTEPVIEEKEPTLSRKLRWLGLAFVPSSLMLGVTTFMSTDIASLPLLWIIPLALYLLTFIIAFSNVPKEFHLVMTLITPVMILLLVFLTTSNTKPKFAMILLLHMATFFCVTMTCHGELARSRPSAKYLTTFYLIMSIGGMLGGIFNGLFAPIFFTFTSEYPLTLIAACLFLPKLLPSDDKNESWFNYLDIIVPIAVFVVCRILWVTSGTLPNHLWAHTREMIVSLVIFGVVGGIGTALVSNGRFRATLNIMLGTSLILCGLTASVMDWIQAMESTPQFVKDINGNYVRWIFAAMPFAAFVVYWIKNEAPQQKKYLHIGIGTGAMVLAYAVLLRLGDASLAFTFRGMRISEETISLQTFRQILIFGVPAMICYFFVERPIRFGLSVAMVLLANYVVQLGTSGEVLVYDRSFFGTLKIEEDETRFNITSQVLGEKIVPLEHFDTYTDPTSGREKPKSVFYRRIETEMTDGSKQPRYQEFHPLMRLAHGTTLHGIQRRDGMLRSIAANLGPVNAPSAFIAASNIAAVGGSEHFEFPGREPLTYYHRTGPVGKMFEAFRSKERNNKEVACIGLGTGSLSSYGIAGQAMTFFEIDNHVVRLVYDDRKKEYRDQDRLALEKALDSGTEDDIKRLNKRRKNFFTYINDAKDQLVPIELSMGDARISLERMEGKKFGLMLIDAFSSDSIPVHLLTKESVQLFFSRLEEDGLLAIHISNRYLDLEPVVERIARELKVEARVMHDNSEGFVGKTASTWIALAKTKQALGLLIQQSKEMRPANNFLAGTAIGEVLPAYWEKLRGDDRVGLWTDDYSPIKSVLRDSFSLWGSDE